MRIPITMCHGIRTEGGGKPLPQEHFDRLIGIAAEMRFESISYDDLEAWRAGRATLPERPIMFDFDHGVKSMRCEVLPALERHGFKGNLFIYTAPLDKEFAGPMPHEVEYMDWADLRELVDAGWQIGAHTITHPNLSELSTQDPSGDRLRHELDRCNETFEAGLGFAPKDFAFTGTSWSSAAEAEVKKRYRFGRLWVIGSEYSVDGKTVRYADLVGVDGPDEADGGPPLAARYITEHSDPYRLPSMELQELIHEPTAFRRYLEGALTEAG